MSTVRTLRIIDAPALTFGADVTYTCPSGLITVVESISTVWGDVIVSGVDAWCYDGSGAKLCRNTLPQPSLDTLLGGGCAINLGRWVIEPGEILTAHCQTGTCDMIVTGFTLTLP